MADAMKPWMTSQDLVEAIKASVAFPTSQNTFSSDDLLRFANQEMLIDQVPSVLSYHEEYYVFRQKVPLVANQSRYDLPPRAVGMKLRDVNFVDNNGNLFEMSRIEATDKAFFQRINTINTGVSKFYLEANSLVLTPELQNNPQGFLLFQYYIRPNQLVDNSRAAISTAIDKAIQVVNKSCMPANVNTSTGDITITSHGFLNGQSYTFISTSTVPTGFTYGASYYVINASGNTFQLSATRGGSAIVPSDQGTGIHTFTRSLKQDNTFAPTDIDLTANTITITGHKYMDGDMLMFTSSNSLPNELGGNRMYFVINATENTFQVSLVSGGAAIQLHSIGNGTHSVTSDMTVITCGDSGVPANITAGALVDYLQTDGAHAILGIDERLCDNAVTGNTITIRTDHIPTNFVVGDYICLAKEAIIPYLPSDLHYGLAERTCSRILASINDKEGLAISQGKVAKIEKNEARMINNRVEGSPEKVLNRFSVLRFNRIGFRRRW